MSKRRPGTQCRGSVDARGIPWWTPEAASKGHSRRCKRTKASGIDLCKQCFKASPGARIVHKSGCNYVLGIGACDCQKLR